MLKFLHTSDWHLGKRLGEYRLQEEQQTLLDWVLHTAIQKGVNGILLSGDIYDRSVPPAEAVTLFDTFLTRLAAAHIPLFAISGNHDSPERISFGSSIMDARDIHFTPLFDGSIKRVRVTDGVDTAYIHLIPYLRPVHVATAYGLKEEMSYTEAMAQVLDRLDLHGDGVHIALCHQFFTGAVRSESEEVPLVGTLDAVDCGLLDRFDYGALGHLHRAQHTGKAGYYAGTLMPFAFSETEQKGCTLVTVEGGTLTCDRLPVPTGLIRGMTTLTGTYDTLIGKAYRDSCPYTEDYLKIVLDEPTPVPDAMARLSVVYPRIVQLTYKNLQNRQVADPNAAVPKEESLSPGEVFAAFFARQNEESLSQADVGYIEALLAEFADDCK